MKRIFVALAALLGLAFPSSAAEPVASGEQIVSYQLENGLDVVLAPDRRAPKIVMNLRYSVGSMNEPAGRSGFAHLFEHLMFSGTQAWPDVFAAHAAVGNEINAWTMEDGTVYYVEGLSANLPMILSLEADRMANLGGNVDQGELDLQRSVVKNEMRQNVLDQAGASAWEAFWSGLFPKPHPYSRTVIGSIADLDSATLDDVRGFFATYYVPNNAVLVLTGDFAVDNARDLVARTFGVVPRGTDVARPSAELASPARIRLDLADRVPAPVVVTGYTGPTVTAPENGALRIAAELLGNSEIGALRDRLVSEKGVATYAAAAWIPGLLGGRFTVEAGAAPGVSAEELESELHAAIAVFLAAPIDPADVDRARRSLLLADRIGTESFKDLTDSLAFQADMFGEVVYGAGDDPSVAKATSAEVAAAVHKVLNPAAASVLIVRPGPRGGYPAVLTDSSGIPVPFDDKPRAAVSVPRLDVGQPGESVLPQQKTAKLANGIKLTHYEMATAPVAYIAASANGGWYNAPAGKEGLLSMACDMAVRGAGDRPYGAYVKAAKDIGASVSCRADTAATMLVLSVPADSLDGGVALLADAVQRPRFDHAEWAISQAETLDWLARREADLAGVADQAANALLLAPTARQPGPDWNAAAVRSIGREEARDAFAAMFKPQALTFYSVGPLPIERVAESLEKSFGEWRDSGPGYAVTVPHAASFGPGRQILLVPEPGASQAALYVARPAPGLDQPGRSEAVGVARLLGGDFSSRLNSVIREEKGYSYGVDSYLMDVLRKDSALVVATTVARDNTGAALEEILKGFAGMATLPVAEEEVNRTVTLYRQVLAGEAETSAGLGGDLLGAVGSGSTLEETHNWRRQKAELKLDAVARQAVALASLDPALIVVAGDPDIILPQLKAIGFADVELVARAELINRTLTTDRSPDLGSEPGEHAPSATTDAPVSPLTRRGGTTDAVHICPDDGAGSNACRPEVRD